MMTGAIRAATVSAAMGVAGAAQALPVVADGGFEGGSPNASWAETSTNFGTTLCTLAACGAGGGTGPRTGDWWAWFGGFIGYEAGSLTQTVTLGFAPTTLSFWFENPVSDTVADYITVSIDGNEVWTYNAFDGITLYTEVQLDLSAWSDGGAHELRFFSETFGSNSGPSNFFVDDVSLFEDGGGTPVPLPAPLAMLAGALALSAGALRFGRARG